MHYPDISLDSTDIQVLPTFHDAQESVGYKIRSQGRDLVYLTDTGYIHHALYPMIANADCYVIECNHDPNILMCSSRPYALKMRILSDHGHLSNEDAMVTLAHIMGIHTKLIFYAHISQECNLVEIIEMTRKKSWPISVWIRAIFASLPPKPVVQRSMSYENHGFSRWSD